MFCALLNAVLINQRKENLIQRQTNTGTLESDSETKKKHGRDRSGKFVHDFRNQISGNPVTS